MATGGIYARLLGWSENADDDLKVTRSTDDGESWSIAVSVSEPVTFTAYGNGGTIDEGVQQVIDQLITVGVAID